MAHKKRNTTDQNRAVRFRQFLIANYVEELLGDLSDQEREYMDGGSTMYGIGDWRKEAAQGLSDVYGIDDAKRFLNAIYLACCDYMNGGDCVEGTAFILRGLGCPSPTDLVLLREEFIFGNL